MTLKEILIYIFFFALANSYLVLGDSGDLKSLLTTGKKILNAVRPLCFKKSIVYGIAPCDDKKSFPACLHVPSGTIQICEYKIKETLPLCYRPFSKPSYVIKCDKPSTHICISPESDAKAFTVCKNSSVKVCLGNDYSLQACKSRFKRQGYEFPELDVDGYYAVCENCDIQVRMTVDEDLNERPIIEIMSMPSKEGEI